MADLPLAIQEMIFGNTIDDNGVLIRKASDKPPYFAVGFIAVLKYSNKLNSRSIIEVGDDPDVA